MSIQTGRSLIRVFPLPFRSKLDVNLAESSCGSSIDLCVKMKGGYEVGDLIWVALPPCLSRLEGGGQVKQFAADPQGESEIAIRLAAMPSSNPASTAIFFPMAANCICPSVASSAQAAATQQEARIVKSVRHCIMAFLWS